MYSCRALFSVIAIHGIVNESKFIEYYNSGYKTTTVMVSLKILYSTIYIQIATGTKLQLNIFYVAIY